MHLPVSVSLYHTFHTFCNLYTLHSYIGCFQYIMFPWDFYQYESALSGHRSRNQVPIYSIKLTHRQNQSKSRSFANKDMTKCQVATPLTRGPVRASIRAVVKNLLVWNAARLLRSLTLRKWESNAAIYCSQARNTTEGTYHTIAKGSGLRSRSSIIWTPKLEVIIPWTLWW